MRYYRGYVKCVGKRSKDSFKDVPDEKLRTLEDAKKFDSYGGVLAPGIVLLDFDKPEDSDIAYDIVTSLGLKCRISHSNKRGYHFLFRINDRFKKSAADTRLACGISADVKFGNAYEILKLHGEDYKVLQEPEEIDVVPPFLSPLDSTIDLIGLREGDGRNDVLYKYILPLQSAKFTREEIKDTLHVINDYVFGEPMDKYEFDVICRDDAFKPESEIKPAFFDDKGRFLHSVFARYLVDTLHIVKIENALHMYRDGIYVRATDEIESEMIEHVDNLTEARRMETYKYIGLLIKENHKLADARYIAFNNGVYDVVTDTLMDFTPEIILVNKIPYDYDPTARDETLLKVMNNLTCGNSKLFDLLCEMVGSIMWRKSEMGWSFFLIGNRANGKSTFLDTVCHLLGEDNISALDLKELGKDFKSQELFGKLANVGDDIADDYISDVSVFKKVATGNLITANPKYEKPFKFRPYATLIFSANVMPRLNDKTNAAARRIIPIPFRATFDRNSPDFDPFIKYKLQTPEAMSTLINLGIEGLKRFLMTNDFTRCEEVELEIRAIEENNNPMLLFLKSNKVENELVNEVYTNYVWWASNSGVQSMSKQSFIKQIEVNCGLTVKTTVLDGKEITLFVKDVM